MRGKSMHVYGPGPPTLNRRDLTRLMLKRDWEVSCLDPLTRSPRPQGLLMDALVVGRRPGKPAAYEVSMVSEFPFDVEKVLTKNSFEDGTFGKKIGKRGVQILRKAKLLHAFIGKRTIAADAVQFVFDLAQTVAAAEGGTCYDCNAVRFL